MRAIVDAKAFSEALNHVGKVPRQSTIPVLAGVLVQLEHGRCSITGTDFTTWLTVALPAQGDEGSFALQKPLEAVRACRYFKGELALEVHDIKSDYPTVTLSSGHRSGTFVNANWKMSFFAGMGCHFLAVSMRWVCSLDYPLLVGLKPVKS